MSHSHDLLIEATSGRFLFAAAVIRVTGVRVQADIPPTVLSQTCSLRTGPFDYRVHAGSKSVRWAARDGGDHVALAAIFEVWPAVTTGTLYLDHVDMVLSCF